LACIRVERAQRHRVIPAAVDDHDHEDHSSDDDTSDDDTSDDDTSDDDTSYDRPGDHDDDRQDERAPEGQGQGVLRRQAQQHEL
jgi:hypothetical protein